MAGVKSKLAAARRSVLGQAVLVVLGVVLLAACSWIDVPMYPVPMTLQSFAVLLVGFVYGPWLGLVTVLAWLAATALGLPLLSGGAAGLAPFTGRTAGYIAAFPIVAYLAGHLSRRHGGFVRLSVIGLIGHAVLLAMGVAWLAQSIGWAKAWQFGAQPFLAGMLVKSLLAALGARLAGK